MGARSSQSRGPGLNETDGHLLEYFRNTFGAGGGGNSGPTVIPVVGHTATGGVISDYTDGSDVYRAHIFTSSGTFAVTALGNQGNTVEYLVIAGGGGGGSEGSQRGGGGGAGGYRTNVPAPIGPGSHTTSVAYPVSVSPYTVTIGAGGIGSPDGQGGNGVDSVFGTITSSGGGGGGQGSQDSPPANEGRPGGSGGGGGSTAGPNATEPGGSTIAVTTPSPWPGPATQGFAGGQGQHAGGSWAAGGGGGGAGEVGHAAQNPNTTSGDGGDGLSNLITGPLNDSVGVVNPASPGRWFAGGGAGMHFGGGVSVGGAGGGGSTSHPGVGDSGVYATGGGGACGTPGGAGGSGIVVVRYKIAELTATAKATGGSISFYGSKTIHAFTSSGAFAVDGAEIPSAEIFVVAGGGGGGGYAAGDGGSGGGGAGGVVYHPGRPLAASTTFPVSVGAGGKNAAAGTPHLKLGLNGGDTVFTDPSSPGTITAVGGGGGRGQDGSAGSNGGSGGGGGGGGSPPGGAGGTATQGNSGGGTGYGYAGGAGQTGPTYRGAGGGGAGGVGAPGPAQPGNGPGGAGIQAPPSFRNPASSIGDPGTYGGGTAPTPGGFWFAGGGGSSGSPYNNAVGTGGAGGAGSGIWKGSDRDIPTAAIGKVNTGGGGGGYAITSPHIINSGNANGGSGLVLIAYPS